MNYALLADIVVVIHFSYVAFIVFGQLAIVLGIVLRWRWVRNFTFRVTHLVAISIVALEAMFGITCPLTSWENQLRRLAGEHQQTRSFMGRLFHDWLFYDLPSWAFAVMHISFAVLVIATFVFAPPIRKQKQVKSTDAAPSIR